MKAINYTRNLALLTVAILGVAACAPVAYADDVAVGVESRTVQYGDLNLHTDVGAKVLLRRLRMAAAQVCGDVNSRQLDQAAAAQACVDQALAAGVRKVNSVQLTRAGSVHGHEVTTGFSVASLR